MWHDVGRFLADTAGSTPPSTNSSHDIAVALIGAAAPLSLALIALFTTLRVRRTAVDTPAQPPIALNSDSVHDGLDNAKDARIAGLETFLMHLHYNPNKIVDGSEAPDHVRFE